jgi:hypothetical protein
MQWHNFVTAESEERRGSPYLWPDSPQSPHIANTLLASSRVEYLASAMLWLRYKWKLCRGPCCMHKVFRVEPSIWQQRENIHSQICCEVTCKSVITFDPTDNIEHHKVFCDVNQVVFLVTVRTTKYDCIKQIFGRCLWCHTFLPSLYLWRIQSGILQPCHPGLCSTVVKYCFISNLSRWETNHTLLILECEWRKEKCKRL